MLVVSELKTLSKRLAEVEARTLLDLLAGRIAERQVDTLQKTLAEVKLCTSGHGEAEC